MINNIMHAGLTRPVSALW